MNEANYRWLRGYLQQLPPEQFDYFSMHMTNECGCVAYHVVKAKTGAPADGTQNADPLDLQRFLAITSLEAVRLYQGRTDDGSAWYSNDYAGQKGLRGIRRAIQCLDEIAASYGLTPEQSQPAFTGDADAFLAKLREQITQPMVSAVNR